MKNALLFILCILTSLSYSQVFEGPLIEWEAIDWPRRDPETGITINQANSGEDWWYDHTNKYNSSGNHVGYVSAGFSYGIGRTIDYDIRDLDQDGYGDGNYTCDANANAPNYEIFESIQLKRNCGRALMMEHDLDGNMIWCRSYNAGEFIRVQQSASGFLALGYTSTVTNVPDTPMDQYAPIANRPNHIGPDNYLFYNPTTPSNLSHFNAIYDYTTLTSNNGYISGSRRPFLVKTDDEGKIIWNYQYGGYDIISDELNSYNQKMIWGDFVEQNGLIYLVYSMVKSGEPDLYTSPKSFLLVLDQNGMLLAKTQLLFNGVKLSAIAGMGNNSIVVSGERQYNVNTNQLPGYWNQTIVVSKYSYDPIAKTFTPDWGATPFVEFGEHISNINSQIFPSDAVRAVNSEIMYDNRQSLGLNSKILVPYVDGCNSCFGSGHNQGELKLAVIDASGNVLNTQSIINVNAYDLKAGITLTSDGGIALVSSRGEYDILGNLTTVDFTHPSIFPLLPPDWRNGNSLSNNVNPNWSKYWNTNAIVSKLSYISGSNQFLIDWMQSYNVDPIPRQAYPGDLKKQECVYAITESDQGGLVISGNSSHNFDDCLLFKVYPDCQVTLPVSFETPNSGSEIRISVSQTWNTDKFIRHRLIIESGATLTVDNSTIAFAASKGYGRKIDLVIEPGGQLIIKNSAKLTSLGDALGTCSSLNHWEGIYVAGNPQQPQYTSTQGNVRVLSGSTIENALTAITNHYPIGYPGVLDPTSKTGGIIYCNNAVFKNNQRDILLNPNSTTGGYVTGYNA